jgi:hypothetical protein
MGFVLFVIILLLPVFFGIASVRTLSWAVQLRRRGATAPGTVRLIVGGGKSRALVRYVVGGRPFETEANYSPGWYTAGEQVTVRYLPDRPEVARVDRWFEKWFPPLVWGGVAVLLAGVNWFGWLSR